MSTESIKRLHWLSKQLQADATDKGIYQESEGARYCREAAVELAAANARIAELESERDEWQKKATTIPEATGAYAFAIDQGQAFQRANLELTAHCERLREEIEHIKEYWNGDNNDQAMHNALVHIEAVCYEALSSTPPLSLAKHDAEVLRNAADHLESYEYLKSQPAINYAEAHELRRMADELESGEKKHDPDQV